MIWLELLKFLCILACVAGLNEHFQVQQNKRHYKNLYTDIQKYDSAAMAKVDSLLITYRK